MDEADDAAEKDEEGDRMLVSHDTSLPETPLDDHDLYED